MIWPIHGCLATLFVQLLCDVVYDVSGDLRATPSVGILDGENNLSR